MWRRILSAAAQSCASKPSPPRELPELLMLPVFTMPVVISRKGF